MKLSSKTKISFLFIGDVIALYLSLALALAIRYGSSFYYEFSNRHLIPFSIAFTVWLLVFYIAGLYDLQRLRNNMDFIRTLMLALAVNAFLTITLFYLIPYFSIAPKTNLFLFLLIFGVTEVWWRRTFNIRAAFRDGLNKVLLFGNGDKVREIIEELKNKPQVGYEIKIWSSQGLTDSATKDLNKIVSNHSINLIVVPHAIRDDEKMTKRFYDLIASGVEVIDTPQFYELVFRKVPITEIDELWFLENHIGARKFYDELKRGLEIVLAIFIGVVLIPIEILFAIIIKFTSTGPVIYKQIRVGKNNKEFTLYKFRTMKTDAEKNGPVMSPWKAEGKRDPRLTFVGRFLTASHLDELPQILNILNGDLSFVGPRPERPEFVKIFKEQVPYYDIRHLVKPGVTGWAQINFRYATATTEDTYEKVQYDLYYIKNRSPIMDIAIVIKTIKSFFISPK
jgi:exopolysaccharide biosynthesis polyprenyl glycosylphosphotransferase